MTDARKSWRDVLEVHPAADLVPLMLADELKVLADDISRHVRSALSGDLLSLYPQLAG